MKVKLGRCTFWVDWKHYNLDNPRGIVPNTGSQTECFVLSGKDPKTARKVATGVALLSPKDSYCREEGRKWSLTKALKAMCLGKKERRVFWQAYFLSRGKPWIGNHNKDNQRVTGKKKPSRKCA